MSFLKISKYILILIYSYIIIFFSIYVLSGFFLISGITPKFELIKQYQRNFYLHGGLRNIWQSNKECIEFDEDLIFLPKRTKCTFKNLEYDTSISFDKYGRYSDHPFTKSPGIAVLGDSHAMGWGVNDDETFSAVLEKKIDKPVYNLAVSGYGTIRELIRFEKSGLVDAVDTIIIQYCYNDWGENNNFKRNSYQEAQKKFYTIGYSKPSGFFKKLRKSFRYSMTIPIDVIKNKDQKMNFNHHKNKIHEIIKQFPILNKKKIILLYVNGYNMKFQNYPSKKSEVIKNLYYVNFDLEEEHFFQIDGHLTKLGHMVIGEKLSEFLLQ